MKKLIVLFCVLCYLLFNNACLSMRSSRKETNEYFKNANIPYTDSILKVGKNNIHYLATGNMEAPTLFFVHGSPGSWDAYRNYLSDPSLLQNYRMIAPDRPGFGFSGFRKSKDLFEQAELLNEALSKLDNGQSITLLGHSYGGPLIVAMALAQPDFYQNLVVLAGALDPNAEKPERWRYPFFYFPLKYLVPGALKPANDELIFLKSDLKEMATGLNLLRQHVLIMHGQKDRLVPFSNVGFMQDRFTGVASLKTINIEDQDHFFIWEREDFVKKSVTEWLSQLP